MTTQSIELIAAVAANGVIGRDGGLPWHLPDDLRRFKSLTMGHAIVMGRRTFESIGRALPGRISIVVSRSLDDSPTSGIRFAHTIDEALRIAAECEPPTFVAGGAAIYAAMLPFAGVLHLTELDEPVAGDTFFPKFDKSDWNLIGDEPHAADADHAIGFRFRRYERISAD